MFSKFFERVLHFFFEIENDWEIGIAKTSIQSIFKEKKLGKVKWLKMPRGVFWADPFGVKIENNYYLFYEEYHKLKGYGTINCIQLNQELEILNNKVIIDTGSHLSFPFLIQINNHFYLMPESCQSNELVLYKAVNFPFHWQKENVLLTEPCMDAVIFHHQDEWHLLYTVANGPFPSHTLHYRKNDELNISWSDTNLVVYENNGLNSRGAGNVFEFDKKLYRATQNCQFSYGKSIVFNQLHIDDNAFSENACFELKYKRRLVTGFHSISSFGDLTLVDRRRRRLYMKSFINILNLIKKFLKNSFLTFFKIFSNE